MEANGAKNATTPPKVGVEALRTAAELRHQKKHVRRRLQRRSAKSDSAATKFAGHSDENPRGARGVKNPRAEAAGLNSGPGMGGVEGS